MASEVDHTTQVPLIALLDGALHEFQAELHERVHAAGYSDIRPGHGCVFGTIEEDGSRLTDLAGRANMTKQSVGEAASDLELRGYVERVPDPEDGRAKIIRLMAISSGDIQGADAIDIAGPFVYLLPQSPCRA